ncbi:hypothetical protein WMW72_33540 [Paenibacillus filicis]|uniref:HPP family protein n=1 Tax=Paenibacillus filicis TaxID=669464 RepID=A0ABU9DVB0_9BACL
MRTKIVAIGLYLMLVYWLSLHVEGLHTLFFPTLGAFSLLFLSRPLHPKEVVKVALGAVLASAIGVLAHAVYPGVISLFVTMLVIVWMIRKFQLNAPPILSVSFIPFFVESPNWWAMPVSVAGSIVGLVATLYMVHALEIKLSLVLNALVSAKKQSLD